MKCMEQNGNRFCPTSEPMDAQDSEILRPYAIHAGTSLQEWMKGLDALVVIESALMNVFLLAKSLGVKKCVLILNMDWSDPNQVLRFYYSYTIKNWLGHFIFLVDFIGSSCLRNRVLDQRDCSLWHNSEIDWSKGHRAFNSLVDSGSSGADQRFAKFEGVKIFFIK